MRIRPIFIATKGVKSIPFGPALWISIVLQLLLAILLSFTPLFNLLGYEFCVAMSLLVSMLAGPLGISAVRYGGQGRSWFSLWLTASMAGWGASMPGLAVICLNALRIQNCNFSQGLLLFFLLPMATSIICSGWAVAIGIMVRRRFLAGIFYALAWLAVAGTNVWEVWAGPQILSYNQLAGWIAGPIYDELIEPSLPLLMSRIMGLALSVAFMILASWLGTNAALGIKRQRAWTIVLFIAATSTAGSLWSFSGDLAFGRQNSALLQLLSGTTRTKHFIIHHVSDLNPAQRKILAQEHELCLYQIKRLLGERQIPPINSWVFSDYSEKRRLLGAGRTQFTKPWQLAIYINGASVPHPTLKHELVHAYASVFGSGPFSVSASHGIFINPGLTEGIAVAVDWPVGRFSPHTWSAALRRIGKAPAIKNLFSPMGFWSASAGRSYTVAGSFVRFLLDTYGPRRLESAYAAGSLDGFYPQDTAGLIKRWENFLDEKELDPKVLELARLRFFRGSVFDRTCAHEIAGLRSMARSNLFNNKLAQARQAIGKILHYIPSDTSAKEALMEIYVREHKTDDAVVIAEQLISRGDLPSAKKAIILSRMGDFMRKMGKLDRASQLQRQVLAAHLSDSSDRTAAVKLQALEAPGQAKAVLDLLETGDVSDLTLLDLKETISEQPAWAEAWYLLGRQLFNRSKYERAIAYLWQAGQLGFRYPALAAENLRLIAMSIYYQIFSEHDKDDTSKQEKNGNEQSLGTALAIFSLIAQFPRHEGELLMAQDWIDRLCFYNIQKD